MNMFKTHYLMAVILIILIFFTGCFSKSPKTASDISEKETVAIDDIKVIQHVKNVTITPLPTLNVTKEVTLIPTFEPIKTKGPTGVALPSLDITSIPTPTITPIPTPESSIKPTPTIMPTKTNNLVPTPTKMVEGIEATPIPTFSPKSTKTTSSTSDFRHKPLEYPEKVFFVKEEIFKQYGFRDGIAYTQEDFLDSKTPYREFVSEHTKPYLRVEIREYISENDALDAFRLTRDRLAQIKPPQVVQTAGDFIVDTYWIRNETKYDNGYLASLYSINKTIRFKINCKEPCYTGITLKVMMDVLDAVTPHIEQESEVKLSEKTDLDASTNNGSPLQVLMHYPCSVSDDSSDIVYSVESPQNIVRIGNNLCLLLNNGEQEFVSLDYISQLSIAYQLGSDGSNGRGVFEKNQIGVTFFNEMDEEISCTLEDISDGICGSVSSVAKDQSFELSLIGFLVDSSGNLIDLNYNNVEQTHLHLQLSLPQDQTLYYSLV